MIPSNNQFQKTLEHRLRQKFRAQYQQPTSLEFWKSFGLLTTAAAFAFLIFVTTNGNFNSVSVQEKIALLNLDEKEISALHEIFVNYDETSLTDLSEDVSELIPE